MSLRASWLLLALVGTAQAGSLADADALYRAGKFEEAARQLTELALDDPTDPGLYDRLGAARYRAGDFEGAARAWDQASRLRGGDPDVLYNSGNAHYQAGRLEEALSRYEQVLAQEPEHGPAKQNKEALEKELELRRQPPPPPPPSQGGQGGEQKPQDGEQQQQQQQQQQSGEGQASEQEGESQQGQPTSGEGSSGQPDEEQSQGVADLDQVEPKDGQEGEETAPAGDPAGAYDDSAPITSGEAHRLLDGVEEGEHRVRIGGAPGGKPW